MAHNKPVMNVQDGFYNQLRKEMTPVFVYLVNGKRLSGQIRRFDRYAMVLGVRDREILVYKHAVASVTIATRETYEAPSSRLD